MSQQSKPKAEYAIVLGASMGGLLAARALAPHFSRVTLIERDELPTEPVNRKGVPQGRHSHALLAKGGEVLESLFPGLSEDLINLGVPTGDPGLQTRMIAGGQRCLPIPTGLRSFAASRPLLEYHVRRRVLALPQVNLLARHIVRGLIVGPGDRVTGVRIAAVEEPATDREVVADLVVDASGRGSKTPNWLCDLGFPVPETESVHVNVSYVTRHFRRRPEYGTDLATLISAAPPNQRAGAAIAQEGDRWTVTLVGYLGERVPLDLPGFIEFARGLPTLDIHEIVSRAEPIGDAYTAAYPASIRRRYERLRRFPERFAVFGDAICGFNPIFGQGMTVAAIEAVLLGATIAEGLERIGPRFFARSTLPLDTPWSIVVGNDLRFPAARGQRTFRLRLINAYLARFLKAAAHDPVLSRGFFDVANLKRPPEHLLSPGLLARVFFRRRPSVARAMRRVALLGAFAIASTLAACEAGAPGTEHHSMGVLGQALGEGGALGGGGEALLSDAGAPTVDDQADPTVVLVESKLTTSGMTDWSKFGSKLAISGDVLVSVAPEAAINGDMGRGAAYVFQRDAGTSDWRETKQLLPHDELDFRNFGQHLAVDGATIAIAVPTTRSSGFLSQTPGVYLFERDEGGPDMWGATLKVTDPIVDDYVNPNGNPYAVGDFATSIALSGDLLAVGAVSSSAEGMVMIFERHLGGPNSWGKLATILESDLGDDRGSDEAFGQAVALDGDNLLIGAPPDRNTSEEGDYSWTNNNGAAFVFRRDAVDRARFTYVTRLESTAALGEYDAFGLQVGLAGGTAIVGAPAGSGGFFTENHGAVYVFNQDPVNLDSWHQTARLTASDASMFDLFGNSLAIAGDALLIGAPNKSIGFNLNQGRAYLFQRNGALSSEWAQTSILTASDGQEHDAFGTAVATDGERSVVGAPNRAGDAAPPAVHWFGAVYVYQPEEPAPPPPIVCEPAFPTTATLDDCGSVESTNGLLLATAPGTLPAPLPIWVLETLPPPEPLYSGATPLGPYYNIGAECTTAAPVATPFIVGVPVPEGADIEHLAAAVLVSGSSVLDITSTARAWQRLTGVYDPVRRLLLVTLGALDAGGNTLVLTEDPSVESASVASARRMGPGTPRFIVQCKGMDPLLCRDEDKAKIERLLVNAYRSYKREGFADPALQNAVPDLGPPDSELCPSFEHSSVFTGITIEPQDMGLCAKPGVVAHYTPGLRNIVFCGDPRIRSEAALKSIAWHELFHAVQFAYPNVAADPARAAWFIEGTATAAAAWDGTMNRANNRKLRTTGISLTWEDDPLTSEDDGRRQLPYEAQDFWVHLFTSTSPESGLRRALPLGQLSSFLERGASTQAVAAEMEDSTIFMPLAEEYWAWSKNQVYEKTDVTFGLGALFDPPCDQGLQALLIHTEGEPIVNDGSGSNIRRSSIDGPLKSTSVDVRFPAGAANVTVGVEGDEGLRYEIYLRGEEGCWSRPSNVPREFFDLPERSSVFVLLANTRHEAGRIRFDVTVSPGE